LERIWEIGYAVLQDENECGREGRREEEKSVLAMALFGATHNR